MKNSEKLIDFSSKTIVKNTIYNLLGYAIPVLFAIFFIPPLIKGLGEERFGLLSLSWIIIGYFSFFDFGIGKSLTKVIAEKVGLNKTSDIPEIFWNSFYLMLFISLLLTFIVSFSAPTIVNKFLNVSVNIQKEAVLTLYALSFAIPIVTTTTAIRGVLEAYQEFAKVNFFRTLLGISTFVGPFLVLLLTDSLFWIIVFLISVRTIIWFSYLLTSFKINKELKAGFSFKFSFKAIRPVLKMSVWITIVNTVGPIILYSDRFLIGTLVSVSAVTFYSTPYEVITKLLLLPSALVGVLFPAFSASYANASETSKKLFLRGFKFIFIIVFPVVLFFVSFAYEIMNLWLGTKFAENSTLVLQFLSLGILFSSVSSIPNNFFQGVGKPQIPAILNLIELPFYITGMYLSIKWYNIYGAAFFWMFAATIDAVINYIIAKRRFQITVEFKFFFFALVLIIIGFSLGFLIKILYVKIILVLPLILFIIFLNWKYFLTTEEKEFIRSILTTKLDINTKHNN